MVATTRGASGRPRRRTAVSAVVAATVMTAVTACGGSGSAPGGSRSTSSAPSTSTSTTQASTLPGLEEMEKTLATLAADETVSSASGALTSARGELSDDLASMRAAVKAALDQKKASRWDCQALDLKRGSAWSVREKISGDLDDMDEATDKLDRTLKTFTAKFDDLEKAYEEVSKAGKDLLASDVLTSRLDSAGTTIQGILAQITGAKAALSSAKTAMSDGEESADQQYATTRTLVDQCNAHWQHIHDLKNNRT